MENYIAPLQDTINRLMQVLYLYFFKGLTPPSPCAPIRKNQIAVPGVHNMYMDGSDLQLKINLQPIDLNHNPLPSLLPITS